jgi:pyrimidine-specific ribonucleoside hydrolase
MSFIAPLTSSLVTIPVGYSITLTGLVSDFATIDIIEGLSGAGFDSFKLTKNSKKIGPFPIGGSIRITTNSQKVVYSLRDEFTGTINKHHNEVSKTDEISKADRLALMNSQVYSGDITDRRKLILDTDFGGDVDDVAETRVLCWAHKLGKVNLIAICLCEIYALSSQAVDAFLTAEGMPILPIGLPTSNIGTSQTSLYNTNMAANTRRLYTNNGLTDAVTLYRQLLANTDSPIEILLTGPVNNISDLFKSTGDSISPLTGLELVRQNVSKFWCGCGVYPSGSEYDFNITQAAKDAGSYFADNCPVPIIILGTELSTNMIVGTNLTVNPGLTDLLAKAHSDFTGASNGREAWGPFFSNVVVAGSVEAFGLIPSKVGKISVSSVTGANTFTEDPTGNAYYCTKKFTDFAYQKIIDNSLTPSLQPSKIILPSEVDFTGPIVSGVTDSLNLYSWYKASDLTGVVADGGAVSTWPDRRGKNPLNQTTSGLRPTFAAAKNGKPAVAFNGSQCLFTDRTDFPLVCTVYIRAQIDANPSDYEVMMIQGEENLAGRSMHLIFNNVNTKVLAASIKKNIFTTATSAGNVSLSAWNTLSYHRTTTIQTAAGFLRAGINGALTSVSYTANNRSFAPIIIGSSNKAGLSQGFVGWLAEMRIYASEHSASQITAVLAEMA